MGGMGRGVSRILLAYEQKDGTWQYEYKRPGYAWVETTTRPKIPKPDGKVLCERLGGEWTSDYGGGLTQVLKKQMILPIVCARVQLVACVKSHVMFDADLNGWATGACQRFRFVDACV